MKKTLITLAALAMASVASANSLPLTIPTGGAFFAGDFSFEFIVDEVVADMITAETQMVIAAYWGGGKNSGGVPADYTANAFVLSKNTDGDLVLTVGRGHFSASIDDVNNTWRPDLTSTWTFDGGDESQSTFSMTIDTGTWYTVENNGDSQDEDKDGDGYKGQVVTLTSETGATETADWYKGNMNGGDANTVMKTYLNPLVPEPTTATLSLLALAGLAARRRRK